MLISVDTPCLKVENSLVDMEASGFFEASFRFLPADSIFVLKVVSDICNPKQISKNYISSLMIKNSQKIIDFLHSISHIKS